MKTSTPTPRTFRGFTALALALAALGLSQPAAQAQTTFTQTSLNSSSGATGSEIANGGTLVRAYHFGGSTITDVTVNGITFLDGNYAGAFTDTAMTGSWDGGWGPGWGGFGATGDYGQLISAMIAAKHATGTAVSTIAVGGLIVGHEYRLQLISNKPRQGVVDVEGTTGAFTVGDTEAATILTATWVAADDTLNAGFVNQSHPDGPHFCGYALHDITPVMADAGTSTVTASPTTVASDGVTTSTITVTLNDAGSSPVNGKTVTLAQTSGLGTAEIATVSGTTNGSGIATFTVKCDTAGSYEFQATDTSDSPNVVVTQTATVTFSASAVSLANSTVEALPSAVLADGADTSTITVTLKDATNSALVGKTVSLAKTSGPGAPAIVTISGTTDGSGIATFTVKSATLGACVFTATDDTDSLVITDTAAVEFTPTGVVEDANSTVEASPAIVPADGSTASTITVTLKDPYGNPVPDKDVSLAQTSGPGSPVIDPSSTLTDASGVATFTVTSTTAGTCVFTATETTDSPDVVLSQTATVTFGPSALDSTVAALPSSVTADGTTSTITVTLLDADSNPVADKEVSLVSNRGATDAISAASGPSNSSGTVTFTVSSTTAGSPVFTATDTTDGITIGTTGVTFEAGPVVAGNSTVIASPTTVAADGVATSTITVTLKDAYNNPVAGKDVSLAQTSGLASPVITTVSGTTSASGAATFTVTSTTDGECVFTATDTTDGDMEITPSTATVTFVHVTAVTWAETNLDVSTTATGSEIANDGTLVRAYHFGNAGVITDITVHEVPFTKGGSAENGLTDTAMGGTWLGGWSGWNGDWNLASITDPVCNQLISSMIMATSSSTITISGLTVGNTYRLQLISNNPRHGQIGVEGATHTLSGGDNANPVLLTATWVAGDDTLNMSMLNNDMHFNAYALHDMTGGATSNYASWASTHGLTDLTNPAHVGADGLTNLMVYALDLKTDGTNGSPGTLTGNVLSFTKRDDAVTNNDVTYAIEVSSDLGLNDTWKPATGVVETTASPYTISYTLPTESGDKLFARLVVTQK